MDRLSLTDHRIGLFIDFCLRLFDYLVVYCHLTFFNVLFHLTSSANIVIA